MDKKKAKLPELLKNALVFLILLAVTLLLLQLPGIYYQRQDEQLLQKVSTLPYSVKMSSEKMTLEQKLTALISDDSLLTVEKQLFYSKGQEEQFDTIRDNLEKQFTSLLPSFWSAQLNSFLDPLYMDYAEGLFQITKTHVFRVIDNKTYSFYLNLLSYYFYIDDSFYDGTILFDGEDYTIFFISLNNPAQSSEYQNDDFYNDYYDYDYYEDYYSDDFYREFSPEENAAQLADYYSDLFNTDFEPTCEYDYSFLCLNAFSPHELSKNLSTELGQSLY